MGPARRGHSGMGGWQSVADYAFACGGMVGWEVEMRGAGWIGKRQLVRSAIAAAGAVSVWLAMVPPAEASWSPVSTVSAAGWMGIDAPRVAADRHGDSCWHGPPVNQ
jgi:hypothetical protein